MPRYQVTVSISVEVEATDDFDARCRALLELDDSCMDVEEIEDDDDELEEAHA